MAIDVCRVSLLMLLKAVCSLYVHLVRPHLDYASQVWSPHQEAVQHRATKLMVGNRVSCKERLNKTSLM